MLKAETCLEVIGEPIHEKGMVVWAVPKLLQIDTVPHKIYCNERLVKPLSVAFALLKKHGLADELKTWDGCFNIRKKRGSHTYSLHSWGLAVDVNAAWNKFGLVPQFSPGFVQCFIDAGFDWGGVWRTPDGMHFQLRSL